MAQIITVYRVMGGKNLKISEFFFFRSLSHPPRTPPKNSFHLQKTKKETITPTTRVAPTNGDETFYAS